MSKKIGSGEEENIRELLIELNSRSAQALEEFEYQVREDHDSNDFEAVFENLNSVDSLSTELLKVFW